VIITSIHLLEICHNRKWQRVSRSLTLALNIDGMYIFDGFDLKFFIGWDTKYIKSILHLS